MTTKVTSESDTKTVEPVATKSFDHWIQPSAGRDVGLQVFNSLTNKNSSFVPANGNKVSWYICGPTVYDSSHLGHARNYVTFDILRRILSDYFKYDVFFVMNITDIDDKIIIRSHFRFLQKLYHYIVGLKLDAEVIEQIKRAVLDAKKPTIADITAATATLTQLLQSQGKTPEWVEKGLNIQEEYLTLAQEYEKEFFEDMEALNVRRADAITRVSEYVPEIIAYIEQIVANGYAYRAGDDVYFDLQAFTSDGFAYNKTSPIVFTDAELSSLLQEGEGALTQLTAKKDDRDFALWKSSKPGEPLWDSPWGKGRPGWHIECSAMAGDLLGANVDINCGGVDLRFPHHDNQLAQSEAHYKNKQWVNYFLHTGHLHIDGLKMSKSEKNFITIRHSLSVYTANQLRLLFLTRKFDAPLDIKMVGLVLQSAQLHTATRHATLDITDTLKRVATTSTLSLSKHKSFKSLMGDDEHITAFFLHHAESAFTLALVYSLDGEEFVEREWSISAEVHLLEEDLDLQAVARIKEMDEILIIERLFNDFFLNVQTSLRLQSQKHTLLPLKWNGSDRALHSDFDKAKTEVHQALLDSFNTPRAINSLQALVSATNVYSKEAGLLVKPDLLLSIARYLMDTLSTFGLTGANDGFQWAELLRTSSSIASDPLTLLLDSFCGLRDAVRAAARAKQPADTIRQLVDASTTSVDSSEAPSHQEARSQLYTQLRGEYERFQEVIKRHADQPTELLRLCDEVRDDTVALYGVRFEDDTYEKGTSTWKLDSKRATMNDSRKRKLALAAAANRKKEAERKKKEAELKKQEQLKQQQALAQLDPALFFKEHPAWKGKFATYDESGFPLSTVEEPSKALSKGLQKRAEKALAQFKKTKK